MSLDTLLRLRTYAKINLFLSVIGRRADGFHEVETILHGIDLYDEIDIEPTSGDVEVTMELAGGLTGSLPLQEDNLIHRAAQLLLEEMPVDIGARVHVKKQIPIAAGLGGGSSNAAGALLVLAEMWQLDIDRDRLLSMAAELGSDVPYCISGGTVLATVRGDKLTPLPNIAPMWFVLAGMRQPLFTHQVYEQWDSMTPPEGSSSVPVTMALGAGDAAEVAALLHNDLEPPAFSLRPELESKKSSLIDAGALGASMSGSGPTMFGIAGNKAHATDIATRVEDDFDWVKVVQSHQTCVERLD